MKGLVMQVRIFSMQLLNRPGYKVDPADERQTAISSLEFQINDFLEKHSRATIQWLQDSASSEYGSFTQLTAIITYSADFLE